MKRSLGVGILSIAVLAAGVGSAAAESQGATPQGRGQGRAQRLADYVGLSDEQRATWKSLHEQHKTEMAPLRQEGRDLRERLRSAMNVPNPDPTAVGQATLAMKQHREKVKASEEAFEARLTSTLNDDQKAKFDAFKAANHGGHGRGSHGQGPGTTEG
jgi:Spy/CpxP family protein refolding chaperone